MKMGPLLIGAAVVVGGLFLAGKLPGFGSAEGADPAQAQQAAGDAAGQAVDAGTSSWTWLVTQPWGWAAIVAAAGATLGIMTWRRIGGWGRGTVLVLAVATLTILVTRGQ